MAKDEKYHNQSQEDREKEARAYVESQEPVVRETPAELNPGGGNVPEPDEATKNSGEDAEARSRRRKSGK